MRWQLLLAVLSLCPVGAVEYFGMAVAAADGVTAVGAPFERSGAVYVYANGQRQWVANPGGDVGDWFGCAVALSGDSLLVGARGADNNKGAVFVFRRAGATWKQTQRLAVGEAFGSFGMSLAVDGDSLAVGADGWNDSTGAVFVYTRTGGTWTLRQRLTASDGAKGDNFGAAVALERDTLVIGAYHKRKTPDDRATTDAGAAYVFTRDGAAWREKARLLSPGSRPFFEFGAAVGVSGDTVAIGEHRRESEPGGVHIFVRAGDVWNHKAILRPRDSGKNDAFGLGLALRGETLLVGAWHKDSHLGAAYVFTGRGAEWRETQKLTAPDRGREDTSLNSPERFGQAVAVAGDHAVIGAPERGRQTGAAYQFTRTNGKWAGVALGR